MKILSNSIVSKLYKAEGVINRIFIHNSNNNMQTELNTYKNVDENLDITFDSSAIDFVLDTFGYETDKEGYIINKKNKEKVITFEGNNILKKNFGGIKNGSDIFIEDNVDSIRRLFKRN